MAVCDRAMFHADNAYYYPSARILSRRVRTDTVSNTAFRGFGGPQGMMLAERMMDDIACRLGLDPLDVRKRNLYGRGRDVTPYGMKVGDNTAVSRLVRALEKTSGYRERRKGIAAFNESNRFLRKGMSLTPVKFGIAFTLKHLNQAGALVHVYTDGSVLVNHGGTEMGQGLHTKVAQVVARGVRHRLRQGEDHRDEDRHGAQHHADRRVVRVRSERHGGEAGGRHDQGPHGGPGRPALPGAQG